MKIIITLFLFTITTAYGATCSSTSRNNYSSGQVLTSTALNADFNQIVTKVNSFDGGCLTDSSVEYSAFDSSLDALKNGIHQGCALAFSDVNTISVGKCIASVGGFFIKTAIATTVTWGCSGCSSEVVSTQYYVYIKTGSTGTTLNLLISSTAPGADGFDVSGNKVIGRFYNNASSNIVQFAIDNWNTNGYIGSGSFDFSVNYGGDSSGLTPCTSGTCVLTNQEYPVVSISRFTLGIYDLTLSRAMNSISCSGFAKSSSTQASFLILNNSTLASTSITFATATSNTAAIYSDSFGTIHCRGY